MDAFSPAFAPDLFDCIEVFCNRSPRHSMAGCYSPRQFLQELITNQHKKKTIALPIPIADDDSESAEQIRTERLGSGSLPLQWTLTCADTERLHVEVKIASNTTQVASLCFINDFKTRPLAPCTR